MLPSLSTDGFALVTNLYSDTELTAIVNAIDRADQSHDTFRKSRELFAIRQFLKQVPGVTELVLNAPLRQLVEPVLGPGYFVVKSIYFDKPETSNWYVAYHQDLTISVREKHDVPGFGPWTVKSNQFAVQPPLAILENIVTVRIHLDDTDETNGALKVIPGSHCKGIYRPETIDWTVEKEVFCCVPKGGAMLMKPLLLHSSLRSTGTHRRRVIHLEFSNMELPEGLEWGERE